MWLDYNNSVHILGLDIAIYTHQLKIFEEHVYPEQHTATDWTVLSAWYQNMNTWLCGIAYPDPVHPQATKVELTAWKSPKVENLGIHRNAIKWTTGFVVDFMKSLNISFLDSQPGIQTDPASACAGSKCCHLMWSVMYMLGETQVWPTALQQAA